MKKWNKVNERFEVEEQEFAENMYYKDHYKDDRKMTDLELLSIYYSNNNTIPIDVSKFNSKR
ncbi:hypothetical protein GLW08_09920 [Pontibacillus yanchengensis]|uniref:Uncharacterized protein n=2 Tax=Pontibacillus yanchengensis TaxID=462910 RepID=A0ACC7VFV1_9BACI|nr:hypothetical protein [Pontibacillus yanchengensis]MYL35592.1 hypothetical protein [Pontibacillus yanchengensis]MYL53652.1 hypothetical protein [Pontibacillus yanchengensis]